jgi:alpha-L-fucosidase
MWQDPGFLYRYKIEGSVNDTDWITLVDRTDNTRAEWIPDHHFTASQVRYVRLTATQLEDGCWMGLREFEVFDAP